MSASHASESSPSVKEALGCLPLAVLFGLVPLAFFLVSRLTGLLLSVVEAEELAVEDGTARWSGLPECWKAFLSLAACSMRAFFVGWSSTPVTDD